MYSLDNVIVVKCDHNGTNGFDINSTNCPYCGVPAVAYTQLNLPESAGNPWRNFADLQTALDSDRVGGSVVRLLADVSGEYTINGATCTGIDLNGYSINGTVYGHRPAVRTRPSVTPRALALSELSSLPRGQSSPGQEPLPLSER